MRSLGLSVHRVLEYDGHSHGVDLAFPLPDGRLAPIAIQCKATARRGDTERGLREARAGFPDARLAVCLHSYRAPGSRPKILILAYEQLGQGRGSIEYITFSALVEKIRLNIDPDLLKSGPSVL